MKIRSVGAEIFLWKQADGRMDREGRKVDTNDVINSHFSQFFEHV